MGTDRIGGEVTLDGDPVEDAVVVVFRVVDDNGDLDADVQFVGTTDDLGEYETDQLPERDEWHGVVEFEDEGGDQYAALSKPFVDAGPYLRAASGVGTGTGSAVAVRILQEAASGIGFGTGVADRVRIRTAAATGAGTGDGLAERVRIRVSASGGSTDNTGQATAVRIRLRAAHGDGSGFGDAAVVRVRTRESTGTGTGSGSARAVGVVDASASGVGTGIGTASVDVDISRAQALSRRLNDIRPTVIEAEAPADPSTAQSYARRAGGMAGRRGADSE